ncbi:hypothetical protein [Dankookia sp. P2]|uniref:hypothetical protein n=1 Tax=Dankookia sp. P2 TaxID=3423955 RepID=UPI003D670C99
MSTNAGASNGAGSWTPHALAAVAWLAGLSDEEFELQVRQVASSLNLPVLSLRNAVKARRKRDSAEHANYEAAERARSRSSAEDDSTDSPDDRGRVGLFVDGADLPTTAMEVGKVLADVPNLFVRDGPVRVDWDVALNGFVAEPLTVAGVVNGVHDLRRPWHYRKSRSGKLTRAYTTLPDRAAVLYLDRASGSGLRPLNGIASSPLLHEDGTMRVTEGYDPATRLWCQRVPEIVVPARPTQDDAARAFLMLRHHFRTFAFADAFLRTEQGQSFPVVDTGRPPGDEPSRVCRRPMSLSQAATAISCWRA